MSYGTTLEAEFFDGLAQVRLMDTEDGRSILLALLELRTWSAKARTDGFIPTYALRRATAHTDPEAVMARLISEGLAKKVEYGWSLPWEESSQKSATERDEERKIWKQKKQHQRGKHDLCPTSWTCRKNKAVHPVHPVDDTGIRLDQVSSAKADTNPVSIPNNSTTKAKTNAASPDGSSTPAGADDSTAGLATVSVDVVAALEGSAQTPALKDSLAGPDDVFDFDSWHDEYFYDPNLTRAQVVAATEKAGRAIPPRCATAGEILEVKAMRETVEIRLVSHYWRLYQQGWDNLGYADTALLRAAEHVSELVSEWLAEHHDAGAAWSGTAWPMRFAVPDGTSAEEFADLILRSIDPRTQDAAATEVSELKEKANGLIEERGLLRATGALAV